MSDCVSSIHVTTHAVAERHSHAVLGWKGFGLGAVLVAHFAGECPQLRRLKRVLRNDRWGREATTQLGIFIKSVAIRITSRLRQLAKRCHPHLQPSRAA